MDSWEDLLAHVLLPVASEDDARRTARTLSAYETGRITAFYVVEKGDGVPDKTPVDQSESVASAAFEAVRAVFPDAETETAYAHHVVDTILETATEVGASAIVYRSRGGNRLLHFLSGDKTLKLATRSPVPVVALPLEESEEAGS